MIFILLNEGELLELPEIKEDELNQELQHNKIAKNSIQENDTKNVIPFMEQSSLAFRFSPFQGTIRS